MSKKKQQSPVVQSRLENLFTGLVQEKVDDLPAPAERLLPGWTWECDSDGRYVGCSPEVEAILGVPAREFLGEPLSSFLIPSGPSSAILGAIGNGHGREDGRAADVRLSYCTANGDLLPVVIQITSLPAHNGDKGGWRGCTQVLQGEVFEEDFPPARPPAARPGEEPAVRAEAPPTAAPPVIPAPSWPKSRSKATQPLGFLAEDQQTVLAAGVLTPAGQESLARGEPVVQDARRPEEPAVLALSLPLADKSSNLLLEILDEGQGRSWSDDERLLVEQVADQLTLALENAQLFEETQDRAEEMSLLREVSLELAQEQRDFDTVLDIITRRSMDLLNSDGGGIWLWRPADGLLEQAVAYRDGQPQPAGLRLQPGQGLCGRAFSHGKIEVIDPYAGLLAGEGDDPTFTTALAVPLSWQTQVVGVLSVGRSQERYSYTANEQRLAELLSGQAAATIQNARLYDQSQKALASLGVRERYQKSVAQAVSILTERGTQALAEVLGVLGEAARASRAYYFGAFEDEQGAYWKILADWSSPGSSAALDDPSLQHVPTRQLGAWTDRLVAEGHVSGSVDAELFAVLGTRTMLHLAVPGKASAPGFIGFDETAYDRVWGDDEIAALQTAASALANTIAREDLLVQVQDSLTDTEQLYNASRRLSTAADLTRALEAVVSGGSVLEIDRAVLYLTVPGETEAVTLAASWARRPDYAPTLTEGARLAVSEYPAAALALQPDARFIDDVYGDTSLDPAVLEDFEIQGARLVAFLPLWVGARQVGALSLLGSQPHAFTENEMRPYRSLAGQLAFVLENRQLFQQTQAALADTERLYEASRRLTSARDLQEITAAVVEGLLVPAVNRAVLHIIEYDSKGEMESMRVVANWYSGEGTPPAPIGTRYPKVMIKTQPVLTSPAPIFSSDAAKDERVDAQSLITLKKNNIRSFAILPLWVGSRQLGALMLQGEHPYVYNERETRAYPALLGQVAAAVENRILFEQTQVALAETEGLYQASAELNTAASYDEILTIIRQYTVLGHPGASNVSINLFDRPWVGVARPEALIPIARWDGAAFPETSADHLSLSSWTTLEQLFQPDLPTLVENAARDSRLDDTVRLLYVDGLDARSLVFAPLNVAGKWIGQIIAVYQQTLIGSETELRRLMSIAGQAAVVIESIRLLAETRQRNEELAALNQIIGSASRSLDLTGMLTEVLHQVLSTVDYDSGLISLVRPDTGKLHLAVHDSMPAALAHRLQEGGMEGTLSGLAFQSGRPLFLADLAKDAPLDVGDLIDQGIRSFLGVPLISRGKVLGTMCVFGRRAQNEQTSAQSLLQAMGQQVGVAIENAGLFEQTQQALDETETLYKASARINSAHSYDEILDALCSHTLLGKEGGNAAIDIFDRPWLEGQPPEWLIVLARRNSPPGGADRYRLQTFPSALEYLSAEEPTVLSDINTDPRLDERARILFREGLMANAVIFAPLVVAGEWIGVLVGMYPSPRPFPEGEVRLLKALSVQAAVAIQNIRLLEESRRRASQLQTAAEIARDTSSTLALDTLLQRSVSLICDRFGYYHASIFLVDESGNYASIREATGEAGEEMKRRGHRLVVGSRSVIGYVTGSGKPLVVNDVATDPTHRANPLLPLTRAELALPLKSGDRITGALDVQSSQANAFTDDDISVLQILADQLSVALDNARSYQLTEKAVEEMREADRLKSQFLANMSHELRTPLNSIIGFSRVILKGIDGEINELQQQDLSAIYNSGQHLLGLINDVLDLSKIEAGKMELSFEEKVNLADLINSVMSTVVGLVKDKPIKLVRKVASDLPSVRADPMKVRQVLINFLSNAAKFTEEGTITVEAAVQTGSKGWPEVVVSVIDTGTGIAPEDQNKLFQPFSQVDASLTRKTGGTGLGLSICRHLIDMHGGEIGVRSAAGQGSTFFFTLPLPHPEPAIPESEENKVVLAIDDERQVISLYERYLSSHGFKVLALTEPKHAIQRILEVKPYAITLDVMMPGRDGWQVLQEIKTHPETQDIPVIICSILENQEKGFSLGAADYLMKPILEEDLVKAMDRLNGNGEIQSVLAVDDDANGLRWIEKAFQAHPEYRLTLAQGGHAALDAIRNERPDAILMDLFMPDMDGFTLLETLRADPVYREIPVVILTAGDLDDVQRARLADFSQAMLQKGLVQEDELLANIESLLHRFSSNKPAASDQLSVTSDQ